MKRYDVFLQPSGQPEVALWCSPRFGVYGTVSCDWENDTFRSRSLTKNGGQTSTTRLTFGEDGGGVDTADLLFLLAAIAHSNETLHDQLYDHDFPLLPHSHDRPSRTRYAAPASVPSPYILLIQELRSLAHDQRMREELRPLYAHVPGLLIDYAGGAVPFQAYGTWEGHDFYFRYRHGHASLSVGGNDAVKAPRWSAAANYGDPMSGFLDMDEFIFLFGFLGNRLKTAPQPYLYAQQDEDGHRQFTVYALSPEQADHQARYYCLTAETFDFERVQLEALPIMFDERDEPPQVLDFEALRPEQLLDEPSEDRW